jgi:signal transduction histidine kinase
MNQGNKRASSEKRVLIVDDHELIRRGVRGLVSQAREYEICGEAGDGQEGVAKAIELQPNVIVMDISMPRLNGLEATRQVRELLPQTEVLIVSQHESAEMVMQAFAAGAKGYLLKSAIGDDLLQALDKVSRHETFASVESKEAVDVGDDVQTSLRRSGDPTRPMETEDDLPRANSEDSAAEQLVRKEAELQAQAAALRDLSGRLMQAQDEERRRIARELHDGVGQLMAAIVMNLRTVSREQDKLSEKATERLQESVALTEQALTDIRTMSHLLHPPLLEEVGLISALKWYIEGFSNRSGIDVDLRLPTELTRLSADYELSLFRMVQECLTNVHRHSGSTTATVSLETDGDRIQMQVRDYGTGIPPARETELFEGPAVGMGLCGMRERMKQLGGELVVRSNGEGTSVVAKLPAARSQRNLEFTDPVSAARRAAAGGVAETSGASSLYQNS